MLCGQGHQVVNFYLVQVLFSICKTTQEICIRYYYLGFPESSVGKESTCNAGDRGSIPVFGRSTGKVRLPTPVFLGFPCDSAGKESACNVGDLGLISGLGRSPGEGTHSSILAWRIPWTV